MVDRGASALSLPDDWTAHPDPILALNRMGSFDWDLDTGLMHMDAQAHEIFDVRPDEYEGRPETLSDRVPAPEARRLDALVSRALKDGSENYGAYFRLRRRDGSLRWTHTQGYIRRDEGGRPRRIVGIVRDATEELRESEARQEARGRDEVRRRQTNVVQAITAALAHARTVQDVIDVLKDTHGLTYLGATSLVMGLVEAGRIRLVAEGPAGSFVPGTLVTRIDEKYPMSEVVRTLRPIFIESPEEFADRYPILWPNIIDLNITSSAYLPLIVQARPIGAMGLLYNDRRGFTPEERNVLVALGSSIAQSLQRAMFYEQEKDLAQGLQQAMLPRSIPSVPGADVAVRYRSAKIGRDIGGDWYDLIPLPGGRVGAVIGDVQGHDTHAAAVMGQLRIVLRAYAAEGHTPATVMARASVFLHELDTDRFATCLYAEADLSTGVMQLVRAGHIDPLVRHMDGTCRRLPVQGGLPLGLSAEFGRLEYPVDTIELDPGETLLLCTDGLVEQPGADLDEGMQTLLELLRSGPDDVRDLADLLIDVAEERGGDDDVALLLMRRQGLGRQSGGRLQQHVAPGDPEALTEARHMIRAAVRAWGARERADEIELVADELITNALMHTEGSAIVTLRVLTGPDHRLRVEVEDSSSALPRRREAGECEVSGRGLLLVDRLADVWGVEARGSGKCVWCEFIVPERS
ncbi:protein phosphatase [Streptomyces avermitilis]|uniref:protein-serine/threonine phosphatase n=2 Tax=Streptomyces avermitilis TaxID=33903 RepID=Q826A5_STRAW|nr:MULTISPECIES: SpoIIE family protein phosphatase [Streptomyces]KUN53382.1 protein phosphatase [Streptomyces avermitilis]MYT02827.1 SpoIIE family protein phosphatase [Streptomyces sp. SID5469]OOV17951.1 protein phosphatase [Streptomyces avermitilis]BAC74999.1 putative magnesium or manganese-dependent protein phosphatase [Streptomyces avermitilis MA-4680 = NBRC 14893]BBJ55636.1 magnesium or manganese-dependent protein phosphatase [Streptomyces avermitilis]